MKTIRTSARYIVGIIAVGLMAFGIPGVHAAPTGDPGVGQAGDHSFCVTIDGVKQGSFGDETQCLTDTFNGLVGTYFDWTIKRPTSSTGGSTGKVVVGNVTFRHPKSVLSLKILQALVTSETLRSVRFT